MKKSLRLLAALSLCYAGYAAAESDVYVYLNNDQNWQNPTVWAWVDGEATSCTANPTWPGDAMTKAGDLWIWYAPEGRTPAKIIFSNSGSNQTADLIYVNGATYNCSGQVSETVVPGAPVVTASPASGTYFTSTLDVTLSVSPAATIYYTLDGSAATKSSAKYSSPITLSETTTISTLAVTGDGVENSQTFKYTKRSGDPIVNTKSLETDYYKTNPNGQSGTEKTINITVSNQKSADALTHWNKEDMIAQGVARDVAMAIKGKHERPVVDSYAVYAAYDDNNLYLGVQYVYTVWDQYGEGKQPGESKPYNMDGRLMIAFDLDPYLSVEGVLENGNTVWDADGKYNTFDNGMDCLFLGSTKPGVGTPALFFPKENGKFDYNDSNSCKNFTGVYGYQDGLLPSITEIWGQKKFEYDPEVLTTNEGFADLIGEVAESAHTFYEYKFPYSLLGISKQTIQNDGIGVMIIDTYGQGAIGSTPYDDTVFDNVNVDYSKDPSTSAEKEDTDIFTYAMARVGHIASSGVQCVRNAAEEGLKVAVRNGNLIITSDAAQRVTITSLDGATRQVTLAAGVNTISNLTPGFYIVAGKKVIL